MGWNVERMRGSPPDGRIRFKKRARGDRGKDKVIEELCGIRFGV